MKISAIETIRIDEFPNLLWVHVCTDDGIVGLTEQFANVYTFESPGGWNIIGNTPQVIFDSTNEKNPNLINPGDVVTFEQITKEQYYNNNE